MTVAESLGVGAGAFIVTLLLTPVAARFARRIGLEDRPGPLKAQARATPYLGGLAVGCGVTLGGIAFEPWILVPFAMVLGLGTTDDARPLPPFVRLLGELAAGFVLAAVVSTRFGALAYVLVPLATLVLVNGCNLVDGLDALCAAVTMVAAGGFAVLLSGDARALALAVAGASAAFLVFNRPPARVYLGDGGSYLLGICLCVLLAVAWAPGTPLPTGIGGLGLVFIPVAEVGLAVVRRRRARVALLAGDRDHPYDILVRSGWSVWQVVGAYVCAGLLLVAAAVLASHAAAPVAWSLVGAAAIGLIIAALAAMPRSSVSRSAGRLTT